MTPPQLQMHLDALSSAGMLPIATVGAPGTHGADVAGMQGIGVSTPRAAAVAAATVGLAGLEHIPNGMMFSIGTWSMIVAAGMLLESVRFVGNTFSTDGATPNEHIIWAPCVTCSGIVRSVFAADDDSVPPRATPRDSR